MKYLLKKIWPLVLLLIASYVVVFTKSIGGFAYDLAEAYAIFATYVIVVGLLCQPLGKLIKPQYSGRGWMSCHKWEDNGKFYDRAFKVSRFKDNVVNAAKVFGNKNIEEASRGESIAANKRARMPRDPETLMMIINETCKSEIVHWVLILISPVLLVLINSWLKWVLWGAYVIANFRDIIIQRYNRPRFIRLYNKMAKTTPDKEVN